MASRAGPEISGFARAMPSRIPGHQPLLRPVVEVPLDPAALASVAATTSARLR